MTEHLHTHNLVIDPEQRTASRTGTWPKTRRSCCSTRPDRRPVAITLTPEQARELGGFELLATAEHAARTTTPRPEGDDQ